MGQIIYLTVEKRKNKDRFFPWRVHNARKATVCCRNHVAFPSTQEKEQEALFSERVFVLFPLRQGCQTHFHWGHISLMVAFKRPNVILGLYKCNMMWPPVKMSLIPLLQGEREKMQFNQIHLSPVDGNQNSCNRTRKTEDRDVQSLLEKLPWMNEVAELGKENKERRAWKRAKG